MWNFDQIRLYAPLKGKVSCLIFLRISWSTLEERLLGVVLEAYSVWNFRKTSLWESFVLWMTLVCVSSLCMLLWGSEIQCTRRKDYIARRRCTQRRNPICQRADKKFPRSKCYSCKIRWVHPHSIKELKICLRGIDYWKKSDTLKQNVFHFSHIIHSQSS